MTFVVCNLLGPGEANYGLANQMFGVAATLSYAKDTNKTPLFPCLNNVQQFGNYHKNIFHKLNTSLPTEEVRFLYKEPNFRYSPILDYPNLMIEGYFQSEKYFCHNRQLILETLVLPREIEEQINSKYSDILNLDNTVAVHIRRGDYLSIFNGCFEILGDSYYRAAMKKMPSDSIFVFFGEHPEDVQYCRDAFSVKNGIYIQGEEDIVDLYLMSKMRHNIIANSSFSWWSAWLNNNESKRVIAPQKWFGKDHPTLSNSDVVTKDLIPNTWERL